MKEFETFIKSNPALIISVLFLVFCLVGASYNYGLFAALGFNYNDFAELDDLIIASFKSPLVLLYTLINLHLICRIIYRKLSSGDKINSYKYYFYIFFFVFILSLFPAGFGYGSVNAYGKVPYLYPSAPYVQIYCEIKAGDQVNTEIIEGRIFSEAGIFILLKSGEKGVMVSKSCIREIRRI